MKSPSDLPIKVVGRHYALEKALHQGKSIGTYLAEDIYNHKKVVVKLTDRSVFSHAAQRRIQQEANVLKELNSRYFVPLLDVGMDEDNFFLVTPFIEGDTLAGRIKKHPLTLLEIVRLGRDLSQALKELHDSGILHRDIKPSNIILDLNIPFESAKFIDFGLSQNTKQIFLSTDRHAGTALYISPEQAGLLSSGTDERSDIYSLGIVLFECLYGKPPFESGTIAEVLRQHLISPLPDLRAIDPLLPKALVEILERTLRKDPRDRYQSAEALVADFEILLNRLNEGDPDPEILVGQKDKRKTITESAFIGRETEIKNLTSLLGRAFQGTPTLAHLEAFSGGGKTRFLEEFSKTAARKHAWVLRGQGLDQSAPTPFQIFRGVVQDLVEEFEQNPDFLKIVKSELGYHSEVICRVLPELTPYLMDAPLPAETSADPFGETRSIQAMSVLLNAIGSKQRPALILLDDCQWADKLSLQVLAYWKSWNEKNPAQKIYLMLVLSYRSEEVGEKHSLRSLGQANKTVLEPFNMEELQKYLESMAGPLPQDIFPLISKLSNGSPFMTAAILRGLIEAKSLVPSSSGWSLDLHSISSLQASRRSGTFLAHRLDILPAPTLNFLLTAAVLGKEFNLDFAFSLVGLSPSECVEALNESRKRHFIWVREGEECAVFVHDKIREALLERLSPEERKKLHLQAAEELESKSPDLIFELAYHFDAAGNPRKAFTYALAAAKKTRSQHALEISEQFFRIAERGVSKTNARLRLEIAFGLGEVLMLKGSYDQAERYFKEARKLTSNAVESVKIQTSLGELAFKRGDVVEAAANLETALEILGRKVPKSQFEYFLGVMKEAVVQTFHTLFPQIFLCRIKTAIPEDELLALRIYSRLAYVYWFKKGRLACGWAHLREMNRAERYPPSPELAQAYSEHAPVMTMIPAFARGIKYGEKSLEIRRKNGDLWGQGQSSHFVGVAYYSASRYKEAIAICSEGIRLLERTGDQWEVHTAQWHIGLAYYRLGHLSKAIEFGQKVYRSGIEIGDYQAAAIGLAVWTKASDGAVDRKLIERELSRNFDDIHSRAELLQAEAICYLRSGSPELAVESLTKAQEMVEKAHFRQEYVAPILPWLATALRESAEKTGSYQPHLKKKRLKEARKAALKALRLSKSYRNNLPHTLRECAIIYALLGKEEKSRRFFDQSFAIATVQRASVERARTQEVRGRIGKELGWSGADQDQEQAELFLPRTENVQQSEMTNTLSLVSRFENVLEVGRKIATALTPSSIFDAVDFAARTLSLGERCLFIKYNTEMNRLEVTWANNKDLSFSRNLALQTINSNSIVIFNDEMSGEISESIVFDKVRSAICVPVRVRGNVYGCLYVAHRNVGGLYKGEEQQLFEFVATLMGAALENSIGYEELNKANDQLKSTNKELEQFAYIASHDLQEPLRVVNSYIGLLNKKYENKLDESANQYLSVITESVSRMQQMVVGLLQYAEGSNKKPSFESVSLQEILESVQKNLAVQISESKVKITCDKLPTLIGDASLLYQLFQNLISNAIKFRSPNLPEIQILATKRNFDWLFAVKDNGIGIDPKYIDSLFTLFKRLHRKNEYPGSGIGLSVCKKIIAHHGGKIWVESELGKGATFFFTIPHTAKI